MTEDREPGPRFSRRQFVASASAAAASAVLLAACSSAPTPQATSAPAPTQRTSAPAATLAPAAATSPKGKASGAITAWGFLWLSMAYKDAAGKQLMPDTFKED